ncbi:MAG: Coenzyme F420 hydrogenase/dehydrogenase, beta subunit C-terminal domain [Ruminococcus sp.]|nr:Coenzyme F420 hydrogenase/dehydrogenase, beta subunit C-terminal domain [Ruminococcus sp.]
MGTVAYACYSKDKNERKLSSSGGIYPLIARYILKQNGIVYSACYDTNLDVRHYAVSNEQELRDSQGSKYVESTLGDTFRQIADTLKHQRKTLFVGTPCQCAGLIQYLTLVSCPMDNLIVMDFVCHGIPSRKAWHSYLDSRKRNGKPVVKVNMRHKISGWSHGNYSWEFEDSLGNRTYTYQRKVSYMKGMIANLYLRPSCYECRFKGTERQTDLTVGDYWGVWNLQPEMDDNKGTSLILLHTEKGKSLFNEIASSLTYKEAELEGAVKANPCIAVSVKRPQKRDSFFEQLEDGKDFEKIVHHLTKVNIFRRVYRKFKKLVKGFIK